ncbi:hypothetical protein [Providencia manganoxydans]|uniref:hypothetical protein n=2 Tax=Morganellaceae TaxID=1903414 RepID=UPI0034E4FF99
MRVIYQACIIMTTLFFIAGCATKPDLNAITIDMNQQQVIELMGPPTDLATQQTTTYSMYTQKPQTLLHFVFLNNQLIEYGQENRQLGHALPSASTQLELWLSEQNKAVNPSAIAGCKMLDQRINCGAE